MTLKGQMQYIAICCERNHDVIDRRVIAFMACCMHANTMGGKNMTIYGQLHICEFK